MKNHILRWLRKSEHYTQTDMVYLSSQSTWLITGQAVVFVSSFALAWFFANYVEPADYGLYKFVLSVATIASLTTLTGFGVAIARSVSQGHALSLTGILRTRVLYGLLGSAGMIGIALYYFTLGNSLVATLFALISIWIPFFDTLSDYQFFLQGKKDFKTQTYLRILQRILLSLLVIATISLTQSILIITFVFFAATAASHALAFYLTLKKYETKDDSITPYQEIRAYAKQMSLQNIFFIGTAHLDKILLFKFLGPAQLAVYFFATAIPQEIRGVLGNINSVAFPKLVDKHTQEFKIALLKKILIFTILLIIPVTLYILAAPFLFSWFFPIYINAVFISQLFAGSILFIPASLIWHYFYATHHQRALWFGTIVGPITLIISIIVLTPPFGLIGAVMSTYVRGIVDLISGLYFFLLDTKREDK